MSSTPVPSQGDYCPGCCGHEHGPYDEQNRCVQCFNHEHWSGRPECTGSFLAFIGLTAGSRVQAGGEHRTPVKQKRR